MIFELVSIIVYLVSGVVVTRLLGVRGWVTPFLGFIIGISLFITVGFLQIVTFLPSWPALTLALALLLPLSFWRIFLPSAKLDIKIPALVLVVVSITFLVFIFRGVNFVNWSNDTFSYLASATLIADDQFSIGSPGLIKTRVLGVPLMHAPAHLGGEFYLQSLAPILSISVLAVMVWILGKGHNLKSREDKWLVYGGSLLGVLLLVTNHRYIFNSFYVNGHLLFAALLLIIVGCGWLLATKKSGLKPEHLIWLQSAVIPALILTRPEAALVVLLALLPTVLLDIVPWKLRAIPLVTTGLTTALWQGFVALQYINQGESIPKDILGMFIIALSVIISIYLLKADWLKNRFNQLLLLVEVGLWAVLTLLYLVSPAIGGKSVHATYQNLVLGDGLWGLSVIVLTYLSLAVIFISRDKTLVFLRFSITAFVPLMFIVAYLRDGAYRVGPGDSFNRMLMHILPLVVLLIIVGTISILRDQSDKNHTD